MNAPSLSVDDSHRVTTGCPVISVSTAIGALV